MVLFFFSHEKVTGLFILEKVKPSPDCKMIKLLTFVISSIRRLSLKPINRMTTSLTFSRHNDAGLRARTTY